MSTTGSRFLHLLRHAKAEQAAVAATRAVDHARTLTPRGRDDATAMGDWMRANGLRPDLALVSSAMRTAETYALLRLPAGPRLVTSEALYLADLDQLVRTLRAQSEARSILLVGHNPGLHELALHLAPHSRALQTGLPTCTLASFELAADWAALGPAHAELSAIHRP